jgi:hypothetical protein
MQTVLDAQRAQNLNIMLMKVGKKTYFELAQVRECCVAFALFYCECYLGRGVSIGGFPYMQIVGINAFIPI